MLNLFISHASRENRAEHEFVQDLHRRLTEDFPPESNEIFLDETSIEGGVQWRERIYEGIGSANAGIIVLGEKALNKDNSWVLVEALLLRWKQLIIHPFTFDKHTDCTAMPLFIYLFGKGSHHTYSQDSRWQPLQFSEIQYCAPDAGGKEFTDCLTDCEYRKLKTKLSNVKIPDKKDKYRQFLTNLDNQFREAHKGIINEAQFKQDLKLLVQDEVKGLRQLIRNDPDSYKPDELLPLLNLLAPLWPPTHANHLLARAALLDTQKQSRVFAVEGEIPEFVAQSYLALPEWRSLHNRWNYLCVSSLKSTPSLDSVKQQISEELNKIFPSYDDYGELDIDINNQIENGFADYGPTFVVFPSEFSPAMVLNWLPVLQKAWPKLNFLLLFETGENIPDEFEQLVMQDLYDGELTLPKLEQDARKHLSGVKQTLRQIKQRQT